MKKKTILTARKYFVQRKQQTKLVKGGWRHSFFFEGRFSDSSGASSREMRSLGKQNTAQKVKIKIHRWGAFLKTQKEKEAILGIDMIKSQTHKRLKRSLVFLLIFFFFRNEISSPGKGVGALEIVG